MTGATEVCRQMQDELPDGASAAMTVVVAVEKSLLRTLAFVLYQLDRNCAKYCATSILQWYLQLQDQLPMAAVDSLEKVADSVVSLSDAQFAAFWRSLVAKELEEVSYRKQNYRRHYSEESEDQEQHVVKRLYQQLSVGIQRFFTSKNDTCQTQTPCTSPVDLADSSHRQSVRNVDIVGESGDEDTFEPGWAVEYLEQDPHIPSEMSRMMAKMMHSNVPTNLFRATVTMSGSDDDDDYYMNAVTPGSFPPTPITRDLQTQRINHYTITVLDHATLTLRLLSEGDNVN